MKKDYWWELSHCTNAAILHIRKMSQMHSIPQDVSYDQFPFRPKDEDGDSGLR